MTKQQKRIGSLQRAIEILELFDLNQRELGVTEIARAMDLPKSTAAGLIFTLDQNGYLSQDPVTRKYSLGYKLVERAGIFLDQMDLRKVAEPVLESLRDQVNESVNLAIRDGQFVIYIARMQGDNMLRMRSEVGKREMVHSTALGKALLSQLTDNELDDFISNCTFESFTKKTITDPDQFVSEIQKTNNRGFALDDEENEMGGRCVAAAVTDYLGKVVAAVSLSAPVQRFPTEKIDEYGALVKSAGDSISIQIGSKIEGGQVK